MKDYKNLVDSTKSDLDKLDIKYGKIRNFKINTRAKKRWGQCKKIGINTFDIEISSRLLDDNVEDKAVKNVIAHELLHTVHGCFAHRGKWKEIANYINSSLPDYNIKTTDSLEDYGIITENKEKAKYIIVCKDCGFEIERLIKSNVVKYPERYRCAKCRGKLTVKEN